MSFFITIAESLIVTFGLMYLFQPRSSFDTISIMFFALIFMFTFNFTIKSIWNHFRK